MISSWIRNNLDTRYSLPQFFSSVFASSCIIIIPLTDKNRYGCSYGFVITIMALQGGYMGTCAA